MASVDISDTSLSYCFLQYLQLSIYPAIALVCIVVYSSGVFDAFYSRVSISDKAVRLYLHIKYQFGILKQIFEFISQF